MAPHLPNVYSPIQRRPILFRLTLAFLLILLLVHTDLASAQSFGSIGIRAEIRGLTLHVEWDAMPASLNGQPFFDWSVIISDPSSIIFGCGFYNAAPCSFGLSTTSKEIDFSSRLLSGVAPGPYSLIVHVSADYGYGKEGASGLFVGNLPTPPILFEEVSGGGQAGRVNSPLKEPFVVRATRMGRPIVGGAALFWNVTRVPPGASGHRLSESFTVINTQGESSVRLTLGDLEGEYQVQGGPITFTAFATKTLKLKALSGNGQTGGIGEALGSPFGVLVTDADGQPVNDIGISYQIMKQPDGARAAGPQSVGKITGRDGAKPGEAGATLTLGDKAGNYVVTATCADCTEGSPVTFTATAASGEGCTLNGASIASQVNFGSGNLFYTQNLLSLTGTGPQVNFTLAYNSVDSTDGPLGAHWTHPYAMRITRDSDGFITLKEEDGRRIVFEAAGSSTFRPIDHFGRPGTVLVKMGDGTYQLTRRDGTRFLFNPNGLLNQIEDRNGNPLVLRYEGDRLTELADAAGRITRLTYNDQNRLTGLIDPAGRSTSLIYEGGFLVQTVDPANQTTTFSYDAGGRMSRRTDPDGNPVEYGYDAEGRLIEVVDASGLPVTVVYRPEVNQATVTDRQGGVTIYTYDPDLDVPVEIVAPDGGITLNEYDFTRNLLATTDPAGSTTRYTYDDRGNTLTLADPEGRITRYTYEPTFNQIASITDPQGNVTAYTYDPQGNLLTLTDPTGGVTRYEYDLEGRMIRLANPLGQATSFSYDSAGNLTSITDPAGATTEMAYDAIGNMILRADAAGATTRFEYDANRRPIKIIDPLGNTTQFAYDGRGNKISQTDPLGRIMRYTYNHLNKLAQVMDPLNGVTRYTYDAKGNLTAITDAGEQTTRYTYDAQDRLISETDPLGNILQYAYDKRGNLILKTDAEGKAILYAYDALNRLIQKTFPDGATERFTYDPTGRVLSAGNPAINYQFTYDPAGRVINVSDSRANAVKYEYDPAGNRTRLIYPDGKNVIYRYDDANRPATLTDWSNRSVTFSYDLLGRRAMLASPNGVATTYTYDPAGRLIDLAHRTSTGGMLDRFEYSYNAAGNRLSVTRPEEALSYTYDLLDRLLEATPTKRRGHDQEQSHKAEAYTYDPVGNRLSGPTAKESYFYNPVNQLTNDRKHQYRYDRNGNLIQKMEIDDDGEKNWTYFYDAQNRLIQVIKQEEDETLTVTFKYDPFGKRIEKKIEEQEDGKAESKTYTYVYDNEDIILEYLTKTEEGKSKTEITRYLHGPGIDEPLAVEQKGEIYFYHADALGSITALTDGKQKDVQEYEYTSFGELKHKGNKVKQPYTYTAREWDEEIGLYYYRNRYYSAEAGRFNSKDPLGFKGGDINLYSYVKNNPINNIDPDGQAVRRCVRPLLGIPLSGAIMQYLNLGHEYLWIDSAKKGYGLAPAGGYGILTLTQLFVPGKIEIEAAQAGTCSEVTDNPCREKKILDIVEREQNKKQIYDLINYNCYNWAQDIEAEGLK